MQSCESTLLEFENAVAVVKSIRHAVCDAHPLVFRIMEYDISDLYLPDNKKMKRGRVFEPYEDNCVYLTRDDALSHVPKTSGYSKNGYKVWEIPSSGLTDEHIHMLLSAKRAKETQ
jgi:hypothetical protein